MFNTLLQQTISQERDYIVGLTTTKYVSNYLGDSDLVTMQAIFSNQQVTNPHSMVLGTSEAIRLSSSLSSLGESSGSSNKFNQWLAGLIDGNGCFTLSKKGYASLEITMDIRDEHALQLIKQKYGGSIKLRSGVNAIRYRLHSNEGLTKLIQDVNGLIRNSNRLIQLNRVCVKYGIVVIFPSPLTFADGWMAGLFDADGCVTKNRANNQIAIKISQKDRNFLEPLVSLYGGHIYIDNSKYISFKWYVTKKEDILNLIEYFKVFPSRSAKNNRQHLIPRLYELKTLKAHLAPLKTKLNKAWMKTVNRFENYSNLDD